MVHARKDVETLQETRTKAVRRKHPSYGMFHHPCRFFFECRPERSVPEIPRIPCVAHILLSTKLPRRDTDRRRIDDDHMVTAETLRRECRPVLSSQDHRHLRRNASERLPLCIDENPERGLRGRGRLHTFLGERREISTSEAPSPFRAPSDAIRVSPPAFPVSVPRYTSRSLRQAFSSVTTR